jgi:hypothetical protein
VEGTSSSVPVFTCRNLTTNNLRQISQSMGRDSKPGTSKYEKNSSHSATTFDVNEHNLNLNCSCVKAPSYGGVRWMKLCSFLMSVLGVGSYLQDLAALTVGKDLP